MKQLMLIPDPRPRRKRRRKASFRNVRFRAYHPGLSERQVCRHQHLTLRGANECLAHVLDLADSRLVDADTGGAVDICSQAARIQATDDYGRTWRPLTARELTAYGRETGLISGGLML